MAEALGEFGYFPIDLGNGRMPDRIRGVVFSNEFFDALPVHVAVMREGTARELRVGFANEAFTWVEAGPPPEEVECYRTRYLGALADGQVFEAGLEALNWVERIAARIQAGYVLSIDYGYTAAEIVRFPRGSLLSYRRHQPLENVLKDPGEQDITAHVCFTALEQYGRQIGLETEEFESLSRTLTQAGEQDQFARVLQAGSPGDAQRRSLQLKHLLFGMGETFRTLLQRKATAK
jgi:SAM-dependent MidA family methyltransferase